MKHIILIKNGEDITGIVGPFFEEEIADSFIKNWLMPHMEGATFQITSMDDPADMIETIRENIKENLSKKPLTTAILLLG